MDSSDDIMSKVEEKIIFGEELMSQLEPIMEIDGVMKLQRKIRQEIEFLRRVCNCFYYFLLTLAFHLFDTFYCFSCKHPRK